MNIFVTDISPVVSAQNLCNVHVNKMLLESVQLLSTFLWSHGHNVPYKPTHINHPCVKWLINDTNGSHLNWLNQHALALTQEYNYRYNKPHKSSDVLHYIQNDIMKYIFTNQTPDDFAMCMPDFCKTNTAIMSYRNYYRYKRYNMKIMMSWTNRLPPEWLFI